MVPVMDMDCLIGYTETTLPDHPQYFVPSIQNRPCRQGIEAAATACTHALQSQPHSFILSQRNLFIRLLNSIHPNLSSILPYITTDSARSSIACFFPKR